MFIVVIVIEIVLVPQDRLNNYNIVYMLPSKLIIQELSTIPSECQQSRSVLGNVGNSLLSLGIVDNPEFDLVKVVYR